MLRIVDVNLNRIGEGLRLLEDITRFILNDPDLSKELKEIRHDLLPRNRSLQRKLLSARRADDDVGAFLDVESEAERADTVSVVRANSQRVQQSLRGRKEVDIARQAIQGGARVIQLRDKVRPRGMLVPIARELKKVCAESDAVFIVNDYLDLALASDADGLHIRQEDLPFADARRMLPEDKILGCSAATLQEAIQAERQGADYVADRKSVV